METFAKISCVCGAIILLCCAAFYHPALQDRVLENKPITKQPVFTTDTTKIKDTLVVDPDPKPKPKPIPLKYKVRDTFVGEIGVKEVGGDNRGSRIEQYLKSTGLGPGYAWCAAFLSWGFDQHDVDNPHSAWSPDWFTDDKVIYRRGSEKDDYSTWHVADVTGIYFHSKGRIAHVGTIESVSKNMVITIEGNTNDHSGREGDRVMRKRRYKRQVYAISRYIH